MVMLSSCFFGCSSLSDLFSGHEHTLTHTSAKASTCIENGTVEYWYCTSCEKYFLDEACRLEISKKSTVLPLADHNFEVWTVVQEATEEEVGLKSSVCTVCGYEKTETIEKLAHTHKYATEWQSDINGHWHLPVCGCADAPIGDYAEHSVSNDGKCTVCGYDVAANDLLALSGGDYGYKTLNEKQAAFYDVLDKKISAFHKKGNAIITPTGTKNNYTLEAIDFSAFDLTNDEALNVFYIFKLDNPLYYWLSSTTLYSSTVIYPVVSDEYAKETDRLKTNALLETSVKKFYKQISVGDSDYRKALCYHDAIVNYIDYAYDDSGSPSSESWAHNVLGVFLNGEGSTYGAVCEGYAKAFQLLLNLSGIENLVVTGVGYTEQSVESHAWNLVKIDGKYYYFDLTWDDQPFNANGKIYTYFCKPSTDQTFSKTHIANKSVSSSGVTDNFIYDLPDDLSTVAYLGDDGIFTEISSDGFNYVIEGYNELQLISCDDIGKITIPKSLSLSGITYYITTVGTVYDDQNTLSPVFKTGVTSVYIPSETKFIWDIALRCNTLTAVSVSSDNERFTAQDGVLYTKNGYTLVCYPPKKFGLSYQVSSNCKIIASYAFDYCSLSSLTVSENLKYYYLPNRGLGYSDSDEDYARIQKRISALCDSLNSEKAQANLTVEQFKNTTGINKITVA